MIKIPGKKPKAAQYVIGAAVAAVILFIWISIPLINNSPHDSSVSVNPFKSRTADLSTLGNDIPQEGGAPGYALDGPMGADPAASGESAAISLFQSGPGGGDSAAVEGAPAAGGGSGASGSGGALPAAAGGPAPAFPKGKLAALPSLGAGNASSMSAGDVRNKFFGSGSAAAKPGFPALSDQGTLRKPAETERGSSLVAALQNSGVKSALAANAATADQARGGAASAFEKISKAGGSDLNSGMETSAAGAGFALGQAAADLKKSDPALNSKKISLPEPLDVVDRSKEADDAMKKMIMQMIISSLLGPMFGAMGNGLFGTTGQGYQGAGARPYQNTGGYQYPNTGGYPYPGY